MGRFHVGTSGWSYEHWRGIFYPENLDRREWLSYYARHFDTVEINSTFYRLPFENMVKGWKNKTPEGFVFAVKGWKVVTHKKRLAGVEEEMDVFMKRVKGLGEKLGVILWQLPPSLKKDVFLLGSFLQLLPKGVKHAIEFRHESWFEDDVYEILKEYDVALCIADSKRFKSEWVRTASFVYVRFHGPEKLYASRYSEDDLSRFAEKIESFEAEAFVYFNNDFGGYAVENAKYLKKLFGV